MEHWRSKSVLVAALLTLWSAAFGQVGSEVAEELLRKSGLWEQLGDASSQISTGFRAAMESGSSKIPAADRERVENIFVQAYDPSRLRALALLSVQTHVSAKRIDELLAWYDSPIGKNITTLEMAQSAAPTTPEQKVKRGLEVLSRSSDNRQTLLRRIVQVSHAGEALATMLIQSAVGIRQGVLGVDPASVGPSPQELAAGLEAKRAQIEQKYAGATLASLASAYEPLNDADLQRYVDFLSSDAGASFNRVCLQAIGEAMTESAKEFGRKLQDAGLKKGA